jgi:hypothetical protein
MKEYLRTIHKRSDTHKKRFALIVSGLVTMLIFLVWAIVSFGNATPVAANNSTSDDSLAAVVEATPAADVNAVTPFQDLLSGIGSAVDAIKQSVGQVKQAASSVNLNQDYQNVRNDALPTNGN